MVLSWESSKFCGTTKSTLSNNFLSMSLKEAGEGFPEKFAEVLTIGLPKTFSKLLQNSDLGMRMPMLPSVAVRFDGKFLAFG